MKYYQEINCPHCGSSQLGKAGFSVKGIQRYFCKNNDCKTNTFMLEYSSKAYAVGVKKKIVEMAINGSGIRDTARVLGVDKNTVISQLKKKKNSLVQVNPNFQQLNDTGELEVSLKPYCE
ncbi:iso-IS1 ORF1 [uncultured Candidatus Thioglobus sp.]|nr:iso-IS1 ORF1 [uncultured Candidatus Thioglobus sp.]